MRRFFVAAGANPKLWAGLFREQLSDRETLIEMAEDGRPVAGQVPAGHASGVARRSWLPDIASPALPETAAVDR